MSKTPKGKEKHRLRRKAKTKQAARENHQGSGKGYDISALARWVQAGGKLP